MAQEDPIELVGFSWRIPNAGYEWREDVKAEEQLGGTGRPPFLMIVPSTWSAPTCLPFDEPGNESEPMFAKFANLNPTRDTIKKFANEHGWMGITNSVCPPGESVPVYSGEPLERWETEIRDMRRAVDLWRWPDRMDSSVQIKWQSEGEDCVIVRIGNRCQTFYQRLRPRLFRLFRRNKHMRNDLAARAALVLFVNEKLGEMASPCLLLDRPGNAQGFVQPHHLLGAMWIQLYQAILGWRRIRPCIYCHTLMDVTGGRTSKKAHAHCVHNAKIRRYRNKLALRNDGKKSQRARSRGKQASIRRTR